MNVCCVVIPGQPKGQRIAVVNLNERGYYRTTFDRFETEEECRGYVRHINEGRGIAEEVEDAMLIGSMYGWDAPGAQAALAHFGELHECTERPR